MTDQSITLLLGALLGAVLCASVVACGWAVLRRSQPPAPPAPIGRDELLRLRLAQHWARGGLLSGESEPWRPACMALAVAALGCSDLGQLGIVLRTQVGAVGCDPQIANVFRQALAEHIAADTGSALTIANSDDWPTESLLACARTLLEQAAEAAHRIVGSRSIHPPAEANSL